MDTQYVHNMLAGIVGEENIKRDEPMSAHTTFRIGGPAELFAVPRSADEVKSVLDACRDANVPAYVLGKGSNVLVSDAGLRGVVVQLGQNVASVNVAEDGSIVAEAGVSNAKVASLACRTGLAGFEFAAGIPGTIGGAAIMNAGAYGGELRDVATGVECLDAEGNLVALSAEEADWSYRRSRMLEEGMVVLSVSLLLHPDDPAAIQARMDDLAQRRSSKQPLDVPSAGSTFKRPEGHFAGKLIQDAGMQGFSVGGAQVSPKHAGFVVNTGGATAADVVAVMQSVQQAVFDQFGVKLEPEVRMWGFGN